MINFVVLSTYVMYIVSHGYSENDISKRKQTVQSQQKVKRLKVNLSGGVFFDKI